LFVTRGIYSYAWEPYDAGGNVILTREARKWIRELVALIDLKVCHGLERLGSVLAHHVYQAVVGRSRLPLTSVEAPLPAFCLASLAYFHQRTAPHGPFLSSYRDWVGGALAPERPGTEKPNLRKPVLRMCPRGALPEAAALFARRWKEIGQLPAEI